MTVQHADCTCPREVITVSLPVDMVAKVKQHVAENAGTKSIDAMVESAFAYIDGRVDPCIAIK